MLDIEEWRFTKWLNILLQHSGENWDSSALFGHVICSTALDIQGKSIKVSKTWLPSQWSCQLILCCAIQANLLWESFNESSFTGPTKFYIKYQIASCKRGLLKKSVVRGFILTTNSTGRLSTGYQLSNEMWNFKPLGLSLWRLLKSVPTPSPHIPFSCVIAPPCGQTVKQSLCIIRDRLFQVVMNSYQGAYGCNYRIASSN